MEKLIEKINFYTDLYDKGIPAITDQEWDYLMEMLLAEEERVGYSLPNSPTHFIHFEQTNGLPKIKHSHKMLSLKKTHEPTDLQTFVTTFGESVLMSKMDGLSCSLLYEGGKLIMAETRGNGEVGESVIHNVKSMPSVPKEIPLKNRFVIDGEIVCTYPVFYNGLEKKFANPRNFAAGALRNKTEFYADKLTFIAWDLIEGFEDAKTLHEKLELLEGLKFEVVPWRVVDRLFNDYAGKEVSLKEEEKRKGYPTDGVVLKVDDVENYQDLGHTEHHYRGGLALKFYDEAYETYLLDIEWGVDSEGTLVPVAVYEPVEEKEGATLQRASLYNSTFIQNVLGTPFVGQKIQVIKKNKIIPQIVKAEVFNEKYYPKSSILKMPTLCPSCHQALLKRKAFRVSKDNENFYLFCNNEDCTGKFQRKLGSLCGKTKLDIKNMGVRNCEKVCEWGWVNSLYDLLTLDRHEQDWKEKENYSPKKIAEIAQQVKSKREDMPLHLFLFCVLPKSFSKRNCKLLANTFKTWTNFTQAIDEKYPFDELPDIGKTKAEELRRFNYHMANKAASICTFSLEESQNLDSFRFRGLIFSLTGKSTPFKNRAEASKFLEKHGGTVRSMSSSVDYLITTEENKEGNSKALQLARNKNVPILTFEEIFERFNIQN